MRKRREKERKLLEAAAKAGALPVSGAEGAELEQGPPNETKQERRRRIERNRAAEKRKLLSVVAAAVPREAGGWTANMN